MPPEETEEGLVDLLPPFCLTQPIENVDVPVKLAIKYGCPVMRKEHSYPQRHREESEQGALADIKVLCALFFIKVSIKTIYFDSFLQALVSHKLQLSKFICLRYRSHNHQIA